jgi:hypothetical protein
VTESCSIKKIVFSFASRNPEIKKRKYNRKTQLRKFFGSIATSPRKPRANKHKEKPEKLFISFCSLSYPTAKGKLQGEEAKTFKQTSLTALAMKLVCMGGKIVGKTSYF